MRFPTDRWTVGPAERALLLCCGRTSMDTSIARQISELASRDLNWTDLLRVARVHGMMPLLYWHLQAFCPASVPPAVVESLRAQFHANGRRNLFMVSALLDVLALLQNNGIPAVPFKGPVLAAAVYGNISLRQFSDLDIFVPKSQAVKASDLLGERGYEPRQARQDRAMLDSDYEFTQARADGTCAVEIHWAFEPRYMASRLEVSHLWQRLVPIPFAGTFVRGFSSEDLLLILCMHGGNHCWERLEWVCGVSELVRRHPDIDWEQVLSRAEAAGGRGMLFLGLSLAHDLLGLPLPPAVEHRINDDRLVRSLVREVSKRLFEHPGEPPDLFIQALVHLGTRQRVRDKIAYCFRRVTTPNLHDWQVPLPASLSFLYYAIRPLRLAIQRGRTLLNASIRLVARRDYAFRP